MSGEARRKEGIEASSHQAIEAGRRTHPNPSHREGLQDGDALRLVSGVDSVGEWLDLLEKLLDVPPRERADVRAEIDGHLRERVRDLMVSGRSEAEAVSTAISEVGDAAALARSLARSRAGGSHIFRRHAMNIAAVVAVSAAVVTGVFSIRGGVIGSRGSAGSVPPDRIVAADPPADGGAAPEGKLFRLVNTVYVPESLKDVMVSCTSTTTWENFFEDIGAGIGRPLHVQWTKLMQVGGDPIIPEAHVGLTLSNVSLPEALKIINELHGMQEEDGITILIKDRWVMATTISQVDRMERVERVRSLSDLVEVTALEMNLSRAEARERVVPQVQKLIQTMVTPTMWTCNGGDRAMMNSFNDTLYYAAPPRVVEKVEALLESLQLQAMETKEQLRHARMDEQKRQQDRAAVMAELEKRAVMDQERAKFDQERAAMEQNRATADQERARLEQARSDSELEQQMHDADMAAANAARARAVEAERKKIATDRAAQDAAAKKRGSEPAPK